MAEEKTPASAASITQNAAAPPPSDEAPKRNAAGVILGKDGKPCRSCNSFASFKAAQTKPGAKAATDKPLRQPSDCPPDVELLGRSTWTLLHSIAAQYPESPSRTQQNDLFNFVGLFSKLYPCWVCAEDFQGYIKEKVPPQVGSRDEFGKWLCGAHNEVNQKLGKPTFDCSKWEERWRTGRKNGSCD